VALIPILVALILVGVRRARERAHRQRLDVLGAATVTLGLFLVVFVVIEPQSEAPS
jgi:hypothetical protein